jgi:hypothetical protein
MSVTVSVVWYLIRVLLDKRRDSDPDRNQHASATHCFARQLASVRPVIVEEFRYIRGEFAGMLE